MIYIHTIMRPPLDIKNCPHKCHIAEIPVTALDLCIPCVTVLCTNGAQSCPRDNIHHTVIL